ncbi:MAG: HEAT repeat domain-containing protein [Polyangiaceae bacterium]|nr:HEAT repeat domain-containing protein [Polyangiaceae bacterium]
MYQRLLPRTFEASLRDLEHPKVAVRVAAAHDLGRHVEAHREDVVAALCRALADDPADPVRAAAALVLGEVDATEALEALLGAVEDESVQVQEMALCAVGELVSPTDAADGGRALGDGPLEQRVLAVVREALGHERAALRFQAVMAYARLCPTRSEAVRALCAAAGDDDERVAHIALRMAEELGGVDGAAVPPELAARAAELVDHPSPRVQIAAAIVAARAGRDEGDAVLVRVANRQLATPEAEDEAAAVELCGELALAEAAAGLERRAFGWRRDPLAWHARVALTVMRHPRAVASVMRELGSVGFARRTLAVATAGRAGLEEARPLIEAMRGRPRRADPGAVEQALRMLDEARAEREALAADDDVSARAARAGGPS